jgi:hypothetical protein
MPAPEKRGTGQQRPGDLVLLHLRQTPGYLP